MPIWRQFSVFLGDRPGLVVLLVVSSVIAGFCESTILALLAEIATALVNHSSTLTINLGPVGITTSVSQLLLVGLAVALLRVVLQGALSYLPAQITAKMQAGLQHRLFAAYTEASWSVVASDAEGTFQELATNQVMRATYGAVYATTAITSGFLLLVLVASALVIEPFTALVVIAAGLAVFLTFRPLNEIGRRHASALSSAQVDYAAGVHDSVTTAEEARVFGVGGFQLKRMDTLAAGEERRFFSTQFVGRLVGGAYQSLMLVLLLAGLAILRAAGETAHVASLGAVILLLVRASNFGQLVQGNYHLMRQSAPYLERLHEAETHYIRSHSARGRQAFNSVPSISFNEVTFGYAPNRPVLHSISFSVEPAEFIGVVGPTGAGKSTLVQLLLGLRDPDSGLYLLATDPAQDYSAAEWAKRVSYVPQEPRLIHGTVAENIRFYRELDDDQIVNAARQAHIDQEINDWHGGYQRIVSQRAKAVSGGQRQRLCLARALAGSPLLLVLDEPTSALDPRSEALVQESLAALKGQLTLFVIAHRLTTLQLCDRVMVLQSGRIEAFASPKEVFESNEFYKNALTLSQSKPPAAS